ncbi:MAG: ribosome assembly RNA-binding protein YhbY [Hydrogenovibrio sp.]
MSSKKLTNTQKRFLKGLGHGLNPTILIGANGVTDNLMLELESTLTHHELIKIKIASSDREERKRIIEHLIENTGSQLIQTIGKTCIIFRQNDESQFQLPK